MITLPKKFKESIINCYYEDGIKWLNNIDRLTKKIYRQIWVRRY